MILKYYEGLDVADKTRNIHYIDLSKVSQVKILQTKFGEFEKEVTKYTFELNGIDGSKISHRFAGNCSCLHYYFDSRDEVEKLIDDILRCHLTNRAHIYDIDENIKKLGLSCKGRGYQNGR